MNSSSLCPLEPRGGAEPQEDRSNIHVPILDNQDYFAVLSSGPWKCYALFQKTGVWEPPGGWRPR